MNGSLLLAALSFEDRCVGAFRSAVNAGRRFESIFFDYAGKATPEEAASYARYQNWEKIQELAAREGLPVARQRIDPYAMGPLERLVRHRALQCDSVVVDISCLTRPHVLAVAQALLATDTAWTIAYSVPFSYGDLNARASHGGWRDTLVLPLGPDPSFSREGVSLGILLLGHEADRAAIALTEIEPATGIAIVACRRDRPDVHRRALAHNESLLEHLTRLRMPGPLGLDVLPFFPSGGWETSRIYFESLAEDVAAAAARVLRAARALNAPIVLFPFGPKLVVFLFAALLARTYPQASWAVYPVARTHPLNYSDGIASTIWLDGIDVMASLVSPIQTIAD